MVLFADLFVYMTIYMPSAFILTKLGVIISYISILG